MRSALGATPWRVVGLVTRPLSRLAAAGGGVGVVLAVVAAWALRPLLAGLSPADPLVLASTFAICAVVTAVGVLLPALRAARMPPADGLRAE